MPLGDLSPKSTWSRSWHGSPSRNPRGAFPEILSSKEPGAVQTPGQQARNAVTARFTAHIAGGWPRLGPSEVRLRGRYCYVAVALPGHGQPTPFLRLRWQGSPDEWAIGIYKATTEQYSENGFPWSYGPLTGTPEQGIEVITPSRQPQNCESRVILKRS